MCLVDRDFRYIWLNDALGEMLGRDVDELIGESFMSVSHEADAEVDLRLSQRLFAGEIDHFNMRKRYIKDDGSVVVADLIACAVVDEDGVARSGFASLVPVA